MPRLLIQSSMLCATLLMGAMLNMGCQKQNSQPNTQYNNQSTNNSDEDQQSQLPPVVMTTPSNDRPDTSDTSSETGADGSNKSNSNQVALALLDGHPLDLSDMEQALLEAAGGKVLSEMVLDYAISKALQKRGLELKPVDLNTEKKLMLQQLDPVDENKAVLLLDELRERRGWGNVRFQMLLRRNAGLRMLIKDQSVVTEVMIRTEYQIQYGQRYEIRLIMNDNLSALQALLPQLKQGEDFARMATRISGHESAVRGGLIPAFSIADPSVPQIIRTTVKNMQPGAISDPLSLNNGYTLLRLERVLPAKNMAYEQAAPDLAEEIRLRLQATLMRQKARELTESVDVLPMNAVLLKAWEQQKAELLKESR